MIGPLGQTAYRRWARVTTAATATSRPHALATLPGLRDRPTAPRSGSRAWQHVPALDGLRGLAVLGVVLYHAGVSWLPGGLLGVDAFFVLSGFLITGLLLNERRGSGHIDLRRFWTRRARRLLPALLLLLVLVSVQVALTADPASRTRYPKDALAALGYVANWRFAFSHQGYFGAAIPSPLLHLWSLGVEEQFYLLWPLLVALLLLRSGARPGGRVGVLSTLGALASAGWMAALATGLGPAVTTDRLYYGTDTRAAALLVGAAIAGWQARRADSKSFATRRHASRLIAAGGVLGLATTLTIWATTSGQTGWLYRGGFLLVAFAVGAIVAAVSTAPRGLLSRLLSLAPLAALGRISYGVYLYHWPLFLLVDHRRTGLAGTTLLLVRLAATLAVATVSYLALERPVRQGTWRLPLPRLSVPLVAGATVGAILLAATLPATAARPGEDLNADAAQLRQETARRLAQLPAPAAPVRVVGGAQSAVAPVPPVHEPVRTLIVGDSIAFSAAWALTSERTPYQVDLLSDAIIGCGIVPDPYADPNSTSPIPLSECAGWASQWQNLVTRFQPAVSAVFLGRWEITDRFINGRTQHIGEPDFDGRLSALLDEAIRILSARSGKVALIALPCITLPELANGGTAPADAPVREARYNQLLREAAVRHPHLASVVDINAQICPAGQVVSSYHAVPLRQADGMHFDVSSGPALGPLLLEPLRRLAGAPARP